MSKKLEIFALDAPDLSLSSSPVQISVALTAAANAALSIGTAKPAMVLEFSSAIKGERGLKGDKGDMGERGLKGDKGDTGEPEFFDYDRLVAATIL